MEPEILSLGAGVGMPELLLVLCLRQLLFCRKKVNYGYSLIRDMYASIELGVVDGWNVLEEPKRMNMQVDIYITSNNQIQVLLQGLAEGLATFSDFDTFTKFIEGCQEFINKRIQERDNSTPIPRPFLDAFDDAGNA
jgi:CheY-like chemotaxis protein